MAFLQGKRYMFDMVVLIYIFLHSSKYSINTVNKPSHNVSLFSASGIFVAIWYQSVSALGFSQWPEKKRKEKEKHNSKPDIHAINLQRQDKEIQHVKYEEI